MVFLVILAGGVVRMTQSGMGCPDWPTCFGRWIPPTNASQLPPDFEKYLRTQDIDHTFNPYHTWIEYINRLLGALLGIFILIHTIWSYRKYWDNRRDLFYLSFLMLVAVGFQGWLGKRVVDANLATVKVTTHMLVALAIAALPIIIIARIRRERVITGKLMKAVCGITLFLVLFQIVLGTQVREHIDEIAANLKYGQRELWIERLGQDFYIHRSFSWIVLAACAWLGWMTFRIPALRKHSIVTLTLVVCTLLLGLAMNFLEVPALAQPLHLLTATILAITLFSFRLQMK